MSKREHRGGDVAALAVALALAVPLAIVSLTTAIAGVLADGHPVGLGLSGALSVLVRLPGKLANPALAWPDRNTQNPARAPSHCRSSSSSRRCSSWAPSRCSSVSSRGTCTAATATAQRAGRLAASSPSCTPPGRRAGGSRWASTTAS